MNSPKWRFIQAFISWFFLVALAWADSETVTLSADKTSVPVGGTVKLRLAVKGVTDVLGSNPLYQEKNRYPLDLLTGTVIMGIGEPEVTLLSGGPAQQGGPGFGYPFFQPTVVREVEIRINAAGRYGFTPSLWMSKRRGDFANNWDGVPDTRPLGAGFEYEYSWVGSGTPTGETVWVTVGAPLAASVTVVPKGGHPWFYDDGVNRGRTYPTYTFLDGADYEVQWATTGASSVTVTRNAIPFSTADSGSQRFDEPKPLGVIDAYDYLVSASNAGAPEQKAVRVEVIPRNLELIAVPSSPKAMLAPAEQTVTLGRSVNLTPSVVNPAQASASLLSGDGVSVANPSGPVAVTPTSYGDKVYSFTAMGWARVTWRGDLFTVESLKINLPDGTARDVSGRTFTNVTQTGSYTLTVTDTLGNVVTSDPIDVVIPSDTAEATVRVRLPRTVTFSDQTMVYRDTLLLAAATNGDGVPAYTVVAGPGQVAGDRFEATGSGLVRVRASYPETAVYAAGEAEATIRIRPRVVSFTVEDPPVPTVSLSPAIAAPIILGESVTWSLRATDAAEVRVSGSGVDRLNPPEQVSVTPLASGIQAYEARATPRPYGTLRWEVEAAGRVEIDGVVRGGDEWTQAAEGTHRLRAVGGDEVDAWSDEVTIRIPPPARATASVPVRPRITAFQVRPPPAPTATVRLSPASGWVNPARVEVSWSTEHASTASLSGTGRSFSWNQTNVVGTEALELPPGPKRFDLRAEPGPGEARWELAGALSAELVLPDGTRASIAADAGVQELYLPGGYKVVAHGPDSLDTESSLETLSFPAAALASASGTVDVTLTVEAGLGGRVRGSRVVPFGETAAFQAEPERGHHWNAWTGDTLAQRNPATELMEQDRRIVAEFAPNRYLIVAEVQPENAGRVEGGGSLLFGSEALLVAYPEKHYRFTGWSGVSASGPSVTVPVQEDATYTALFERLRYQLTVRSEGGGTGLVTPGTGLQLAGTEVVLTAQPDARSRLIGWSGDASGSSPTVTVDMEADREVVVRFEPKLAQVITLDRPEDQEPGHGVAVAPTSNSGLAVRLVVVSGPAELRGGTVWVTGVGPIVLRATQEGNDVYLPADPAEVAFAGVQAPSVALQEAGASVTLQNSQTREPNWQVKGE
jgi:hypothetical protein